MGGYRRGLLFPTAAKRSRQRYQDEDRGGSFAVSLERDHLYDL